MTDPLAASIARHPSNPPRLEPAVPPAAQKRARLLDELEQINAALARHSAPPDMTVDEAATLTNLRTLKVIVEASGHRLADLVKANTW